MAQKWLEASPPPCISLSYCPDELQGRKKHSAAADAYVRAVFENVVSAMVAWWPPRHFIY